MFQIKIIFIMNFWIISIYYYYYLPMLYILDTTYPHLKNKLFAIKFKFQRTLQSFLYLCKKKTQIGFFSFFISSTFHFYLMNALVYDNIDQDIHKWKNESCSKWKTKKITWVFSLYKYRKFWTVSLEFKLERKTSILEVCTYII